MGRVSLPAVSDSVASIGQCQLTLSYRDRVETVSAMQPYEDLKLEFELGDAVSRVQIELRL